MFKRVRLLIKIECVKKGLHSQEEVFCKCSNRLLFSDLVGGMERTYLVITAGSAGVSKNRSYKKQLSLYLVSQLLCLETK